MTYSGVATFEVNVFVKKKEKKRRETVYFTNETDNNNNKTRSLVNPLGFITF